MNMKGFLNKFFITYTNQSSTYYFIVGYNIKNNNFSSILQVN